MSILVSLKNYFFVLKFVYYNFTLPHHLVNPLFID
ncbi:MAG: hypothetical protein MRERV_15c001 [Mycoplasmataceae bacterium RV_VA103A]|nr:MAG: hypothetical protein MRERV_15c001 [Mycoplasmataceae bacterium RV_VA103A]